MINEDDTRELYLVVETDERVIERRLLTTTARHILIAYNDIMNDYAIRRDARHQVKIIGQQPLTPAALTA